MKLETKYAIGQRVERNGVAGHIVQLSVRQNNCIWYEVSWLDQTDSWHYDFEFDQKSPRKAGFKHENE